MEGDLTQDEFAEIFGDSHKSVPSSAAAAADTTVPETDACLDTVQREEDEAKGSVDAKMADATTTVPHPIDTAAAAPRKIKGPMASVARASGLRVSVGSNVRIVLGNTHDLFQRQFSYAISHCAKNADLRRRGAALNRCVFFCAKDAWRAEESQLKVASEAHWDALKAIGVKLSADVNDVLRLLAYLPCAAEFSGASDICVLPSLLVIHDLVPVLSTAVSGRLTADQCVLKLPRLIVALVSAMQLCAKRKRTMQCLFGCSSLRTDFDRVLRPLLAHWGFAKDIQFATDL